MSYHSSIIIVRIVVKLTHKTQELYICSTAALTMVWLHNVL